MSVVEGFFFSFLFSFIKRILGNIGGQLHCWKIKSSLELQLTMSTRSVILIIGTFGEPICKQQEGFISNSCTLIWIFMMRWRFSIKVGPWCCYSFNHIFGSRIYIISYLFPFNLFKKFLWMVSCTKVMQKYIRYSSLLRLHGFCCDCLFYCCSTALEIEVGGGRKISEFSTIRMLYTIGVQVIASLFTKSKLIFY